MHNCQRFGQLQNVSAAETLLAKFPSPRWEFLLTCPIDSHLSIWIDIWFYQGRVRASHTCKLPNAPMGKLLMRSCFDFRLRNCERRFGQLQDVRAAETLQSSHRPDGKIAHALALNLAYATATDASINYSMYVPQRPAISHRHGKIADVLALTHACTTANASVNYSWYVPQRPSKVAIARWESC